MQEDLIKRIEKELKFQRDLHLSSADEEHLGEKWNALVKKEPARFINPDFTLNTEVLKNFRRLNIFTPETPDIDYNKFNFKNILSGSRRGAKRLMMECYYALEKLGHLDLLRRYPCHPAGNPYIFKYKGYEYTDKWHRHIHYLGLMKEVLADKLRKGFVGLDIGSSYGIFSSLVKKEFPDSRHVLVDFQEHLILAYYFLGSCFPDAKIAGLKEISDMETISLEFIKDYDFVLIPYTYYLRIAPYSIDIVSNFASFGEMQRKWFDYYLKSPPFLTAKYFFTANRVQSYPTYDTDLTILDYPVWDKDRILYFGISPLCHSTYIGKYWFFYEKLVFSSQFFEYIGKI